MLCKEIDMKLYIIANRLPVKVAGTNGKFAFSRSEGGLATGLDSLQTSYQKHWKCRKQFPVGIAAISGYNVGVAKRKSENHRRKFYAPV